METTGFGGNISMETTGFGGKTTGFGGNISMESTKVYMDTTVFWDVEDFLILNSLDPCLLYGNITSKLHHMRCIGFPILSAFVGDNITSELKDMYRSAGIRFWVVPDYGTKYARVHNMALETYMWALRSQSVPSKLIILSKSMGEEKQLASVIEDIKMKVDCDIVFLDPTSLLDKSGGTPSKTSDEPIYCCQCKKPLIKEGQGSSSQNQ